MGLADLFLLFHRRLPMLNMRELMLKMREWANLGAWQLSANAKNVSDNTKSSLAAILTLQDSFFLSTFEANN